MKQVSASCLVRQSWLANRKGFVRNWPRLIGCTFIRRKGKSRKLLGAPCQSCFYTVYGVCMCLQWRVVCHVKAREWITLCVHVQFFFFFLGAIKGSLPKGFSAQEVHCCSVLHNAVMLAIVFTLYLRPLGDIMRHHSILSSAPKWHPDQHLFWTQSKKGWVPAVSGSVGSKF